MSDCCKVVAARKSSRRVDVAGWIGTAALYALIPKCPACLAAHVAVWTGVGLSFGAAEFVRTALLAACVVAAVILVVRWRVRVASTWSDYISPHG